MFDVISIRHSINYQTFSLHASDNAKYLLGINCYGQNLKMRKIMNGEINMFTLYWRTSLSWRKFPIRNFVGIERLHRSFEKFYFRIVDR